MLLHFPGAMSLPNREEPLGNPAHSLPRRPPASPLSEVRPTYLLSRWLFLRLLGLVYLVAFVSLAVQITGLVGEHGILPARDFLDQARTTYGGAAYRLFPTLCWLGAGDGAQPAESGAETRRSAHGGRGGAGEGCAECGGRWSCTYRRGAGVAANVGTRMCSV